MKFKLYFITVLLLLFQTVIAQNSKCNLPPKNYYKRAKITLNDNTCFKAREVFIKNDSISFIEQNGINKHLYIGDIKCIKIKKSNTALFVILGIIGSGVQHLIIIYLLSNGKA